MSNIRKPEARLEGLEGPSFPPCIEELQRAFYGQPGRNFKGSTLESFGRSMSSFAYVANERTSDSYKWFWAMNFKTIGGRVAILFPYGGDNDRTDGTTADRHAALYRDKGCSDSIAEGIVRNVLAAHAVWLQSK